MGLCGSKEDENAIHIEPLHIESLGENHAVVTLDVASHNASSSATSTSHTPVTRETLRSRSSSSSSSSSADAKSGHRTTHGRGKGKHESGSVGKKKGKTEESSDDSDADVDSDGKAEKERKKEGGSGGFVMKSAIDCGGGGEPSPSAGLDKDVVGEGASLREMKFVCISDTHWHHDGLVVPPGDVLLVCGDFLKFRHHISIQNVKQFDAWLGTLPHKRKFVICGNHENCLKGKLPTRTSALFTNATYLQDTGECVSGINIWGTPWHLGRSIYYQADAFGTSAYWLKHHYSAIPPNTHIVMTHAPPHGILEAPGEGSLSLRAYVLDRIKPKVLVFGHSHGFTGMTKVVHSDHSQTLCINAGQALPGCKPFTFTIKVDSAAEMQSSKVSIKNARDEHHPKTMQTTPLEIAGVANSWATVFAQPLKCMQKNRRTIIAQPTTFGSASLNQMNCPPSFVTIASAAASSSILMPPPTYDDTTIQAIDPHHSAKISLLHHCAQQYDPAHREWREETEVQLFDTCQTRHGSGLETLQIKSANEKSSLQSQAYVFVATNDYHLRGFMALVMSLKMAHTTRNMRMLCTPKVPDYFKEIFSTLGVDIRGIPDSPHPAAFKPSQVWWNDTLSKVRREVEILISLSNAITLYKLEIWKQTDLTKLVYMDADTIVMHNIDYLFTDVLVPFSTMPDSWLCEPHPEHVNSGLMVITPSTETYTSLITSAETRDTWSGDQQVIENILGAHPLPEEKFPFVFRCKCEPDNIWLAHADVFHFTKWCFDYAELFNGAGMHYITNILGTAAAPTKSFRNSTYYTQTISPKTPKTLKTPTTPTRPTPEPGGTVVVTPEMRLLLGLVHYMTYLSLKQGGPKTLPKNVMARTVYTGLLDAWRTDNTVDPIKIPLEGKGKYHLLEDNVMQECGNFHLGGTNKAEYFVNMG
ncbi:Ser/Thr phosphatase family superfamily protein [Pelomyxa schiedti]|nr:Ser/Thr phosphatase family superfamily protein [Pelomyxa schiedti]